MMSSAVDSYNRCPSKSSKLLINPFKVHPVIRKTQANPSFKKPKQLGFISLDGNPQSRSYHDDARQLRYYCPPVYKNFRLNLKDGYDSYIEKDDNVKERLTYLLMWISRHSNIFRVTNDKVDINDTRFRADFIAWRGNVTKLLITPYEKREPWKMAVSLFKGTIFISDVETDKAKFDRLNRSAHHKEMCYWGHKFEDYMTRSCKDEKPDHCTPSLVNDNEEFRSIIHTQLDGHAILMGAEIDCCIQSHHGDPPDNYVELKTSRLMNSFRQRENFFRFKLLKFWAQSYLSGVPKIVVGLRDEMGIVSSLKEYHTLSIPYLSEGQQTVQWDPNQCLRFLSDVLSWLQKIVLLDDPNIVYMMTFSEPYDYINIEKVDDGSERFIPSWFTDAYD